MTATATTSRADAATAIVSAFFDAYRARDVEAMIDLCTDNADFDYIPFEVEANNVPSGAGGRSGASARRSGRA